MQWAVSTSCPLFIGVAATTPADSKWCLGGHVSEDCRWNISVTSSYCFACIGSGSDLAEAHEVRLWPAGCSKS